MAQEVLNYFDVAMLGGAHEGGTAVFVLYVDVGARLQKHGHHVQASVAHRQHQSGLSMLEMFAVQLG